jgi:predicted nucleic acid-binding protein
MIVVADTSPFVGLINLGRVDLLATLFGRVIIPSEVLDELRSPKRPAAVQAFAATPPEWLEVRAPVTVEPIAELHAGERASISLARECGAGLLIIDETKGREAARGRGILVTGTIGILEAAADRGIVQLEDEFDRLKVVGFWVSPKLLDARLTLFRERKRSQEQGRKDRETLTSEQAAPAEGTG